MIEIYSPSNNNFGLNGDMVLTPTMCEVHSEINSPWTLEMEHPIDDIGRWKLIVANAVVRVPSHNGDQLFRIVKTTKTESGVSVTARPIFMDAAKDCFIMDTRPTLKTGQQALNDILSANNKYSGLSNITRLNTAYYVLKNAMEAISGNENSFLERWGGEIEFNNYQIVINDRLGADMGVEILYGKNIPSDGISEIVNTDDVVTRIVPKAYNGRMISGNTPWVDSPLINVYPTVKTKIFEYPNIRLASDVNTSEYTSGLIICETQEDLNDALINAAEIEYESGVDKPKVTINCNLVDLRNTEEYAEYADLETVKLGDTVYCKHRILDIETEARVTTLVWNCITKSIKKITIGEPSKAFIDRLIDSMKSVDTLKVIADDLQLQLNTMEIGGVNLLIDTNASSLTKVYADKNRYWSDSGTTSVVPSFIPIENPPLPNIKNGAQFVINTADTKFKALCWYAQSGFVSMVDGEEYTLSAYCKKTSGNKVRVMFLYGMSPYVRYYEDIEGTDWQRVVWTFKYSSQAAGSSVGGARVYFGVQSDYVGTVEMCGFQLEQGNVATPYSPSPVETQGQINNLQTATQGLETRLDELKIGGTNILRGTDEMLLNANRGNWNVGAFYKSGTGAIATVDLTDSPVVGVTKGIKLTQTSANTPIGFAQGNLPLTNEQVTFSVWVKGSVGTKVILQAWYKANAYEPTTITLDTTEWTKLSYTPTMLPPSESVPGGYVYIGNTNTDTELKELLVCAPKLEYGNQATDWSVSPFDNTNLGNGRNLLLKSDERLESNAYFLKSWNFGDVKPIENEVYTIQIKGHLSTDKQAFLLYNTTGSGNGQYILGGGYKANNNASSSTWITSDHYDEQTGIYTAKLVAVVGTQANTSLRIYAYPNAESTDPNIIEWVKLEKGTTPTGWSPAPEDIEDEVNSLTNYINGEISTIQSQVDGKIETFYQTTDPSTSWTSAQKAEHEGDIWQNSSTGKTYRWNGSAWQEMTTMPPSAVIDTIDGKAQIFISTPTVPYHKGDLWFNSTTSNIMTCINNRTTGSYTASDWQKRNKYTDDTALNTFISGAYSTDKTNLQNQIDSKAETWYQSTDPSSSWTTAALKAQHEGDLWYNTTNNTTWFYNGTTWQQQNIPKDVFDTIDGKAQIFISTPTVPYHKGDLWFNSTTSDIMTCINNRTTGSYTASDWQKRNKYTDDTAVENLVIGGRNYLRRIDPGHNGSIIQNVTVTYDPKTGMYVLKPTATGASFKQIYAYDSVSPDVVSELAGKEVTYSIKECSTTRAGGNVRAYLYYYRTSTSKWVSVDLTQGQKVKTLTLPDDVSRIGLILRCDQSQADTTSDVVTFFGVKLELGSKATDWTPAPEDIEDNLDELTSVTGGLVTTTNELSQVAQTLQQQLDDIEIGGVNLLLDTNAPGLTKVYADVNRYWSDSANASSIPFEFVQIQNPPQPNIKYGIKGRVATITTGRRGIAFYSGSTSVVGVPLQAGKSYTMSCYVRLVNGTKVRISCGASDGATTTYREKINVDIEGSGWQRVEGYITATGTSSTSVNGRVYFGIRGTYECEVEMCGFQFELGNYATTYNRPFEGEMAVQQLNNYFWHDSAGAHVTSVEGDATTGYNTLIGSTAMDIRDGATSLASFGSATRIGTLNGRNMLITPAAMEARTGTTVDASFGATTVIGRTGTNDYNTYIDSASLQLRKGDVPYVELDGSEREVAIGDMDFFRTRVGVGMLVVEGGENTTYIPPVPEATQKLADQIARLAGHRTNSGSGASKQSHMYGNLMLARAGYHLECIHGWTGTSTYTSDYVEVEESVGGSTGVANPSKLTSYGGDGNKIIYTDVASGIGVYNKNPKLYTVQPVFSIDWNGTVTSGSNWSTATVADTGTWNTEYVTDYGHTNLIKNGVMHATMWFRIKKAVPYDATLFTFSKAIVKTYSPMSTANGIMGSGKIDANTKQFKANSPLSSASYPSAYIFVDFARPLA